MSLSANFLPSRIFCTVLVFSVSSFFGLAAQNNTATPSQSQPRNQQTATKDDEKKEATKKVFDPEMQELSGREFMTQDYVALCGSFYAGHANKDTVPVVLLHGQKESREEFTPLIAEMKKRGYAILAFDFRGHGESTTRYELATQGMDGQTTPAMEMGMGMQPMVMPQSTQRSLPPGMGGGIPGRRNRQENMMPNPAMMPAMMPQMPMQLPKPVEYLEEGFKKVDYDNMYNFDCVPFYRFLVNKNNEGQLNLNKLVIVGIDMGGTVGGRLTKQLWANARGKNVRSLIIVSPNDDKYSEAIFKDSKCFHKEVPLLMIVGQLDNRAKDNAQNLRKNILGKEKAKEEQLRIAEFPTERQGGELLRESKLGIPQKIADDIDETLARQKNLNWRKMTL